MGWLHVHRDQLHLWAWRTVTASLISNLQWICYANSNVLYFFDNITENKHNTQTLWLIDFSVLWQLLVIYLCSPTANKCFQHSYNGNKQYSASVPSIFHKISFIFWNIDSKQLRNSSSLTTKHDYYNFGYGTEPRF